MGVSCIVAATINRGDRVIPWCCFIEFQPKTHPD